MVYVKKVKVGKKEYYYFVESYREDGKVKHRTLRRLSEEECKNPQLALVEFKKGLEKKNYLRIKKVIVLAAGKSTRLYPLATKFPAAMLKLNERRLIDYLLDLFHQTGVKDAIVVGGLNIESLTQHLKKRALVLFNPFYGTTRSLSSLYFAKDSLNEGVFVCYGDILFPRTVLQQMIETRSDIVIAVSPGPLDDESEKIFIREGKLISVSKDSPLVNPEGVFIGLAMFSAKGIQIAKTLLDQVMQEDLFREYEFSVLLERISQAGHSINILKINEPWIDIDYPYEVEIAKEDILPLLTKNIDRSL